MDIQPATCKSILTRTGGYLSKISSHSMNPYTGCGYGNTLCGVGCYVRSNEWLTRGRPWGQFVDVKENAAQIYSRSWEKERRWAHRQGHPFSIFLASSTEPWQPAERKFRVTRQLLDEMCVHPPDELILQTHSNTILEDRHRIVALSAVTKLRVHVSIESDRDRLPGLPKSACTVDERIETIRSLAEAECFVVATMAPLLPVEQPKQFFQRLVEAGASAVVIDHFIGGDGTLKGTRTLKTPLPKAMHALLPESIETPYRDRIAAIARQFLPTGVSSAGFAGQYTTA